jgi:hypothetical protein
MTIRQSSTSLNGLSVMAEIAPLQAIFGSSNTLSIRNNVTAANSLRTNWQYAFLNTPSKSTSPQLFVRITKDNSASASVAQAWKEAEEFLAEWDAGHFGDQIDDEWLINLRSSWQARLDDLYGFEPE